MSETATAKPSAKRKRWLWVGKQVQVLIDRHDWIRAIIFTENGRLNMIGPLGCVVQLKQLSGKTERQFKRFVEKELRDAGY